MEYEAASRTERWLTRTMLRRLCRFSIPELGASMTLPWHAMIGRQSYRDSGQDGKKADAQLGLAKEG